MQVVAEHEPWFYQDENGVLQVGGGVDEYRNLRFVSVKVTLSPPLWPLQFTI